MPNDSLHDDLLGLKPKKKISTDKQIPWQVFVFTFGLYLLSKAIESVTSLPFDVLTVLLIITYFTIYAHNQANQEPKNG